MKTIGFFTGARSEYGIMKQLIKAVDQHKSFRYELYVSGIHLLKSYGNTVREIREDGLLITERVSAFKENKEPDEIEFTSIIFDFTKILKRYKPDLLFIFGDRFEAYAAALSAHFASTPLAHFGGGTLTKGSLDNIYRFNISNLAKIHFCTSISNYERLKSQILIDANSTYFVGSVAIESILTWKRTSISISSFIDGILPGKYALLTFHPATACIEPLDLLLKEAVLDITSRGDQVLITYPNNDPGSSQIVSAIKKVEKIDSVFVVKNLGVSGYFAALNEAKFVLGNSSSGIIEAPYFNKRVINVGSRQEGRDKDKTIHTIPPSIESLKDAISKGYKDNWKPAINNFIYGKGGTVNKVITVLEEILI